MTETTVQDACYRCGYRLIGITDEQACPECGLLAARSRRVSDELENARPVWLHKLSLGTKLMLIGLMVASSWPLIFGYLAPTIYAKLAALGPAISRVAKHVVLFAGLDAGLLLLLLGIWLLTAPERHAPSDDADLARRRTLRLASFLPIGVMTVLHAIVTYYTPSEFLSLQRNTALNMMRAGLCVMLVAAAIAIPPLLFSHLRAIAHRVRSAHLVEHCRIVGVGSTCAILPLVALLMIPLTSPIAFGWPEGWENSTVVFILMVVIVVMSNLFLLWSMYVFVRFTISFHVAAKALRSNWRRDDRSLESSRVTSAPPGSA